MQIEPKGKECAGCKRSGANILTHKDMDINVGVQGNLKKKLLVQAHETEYGLVSQHTHLLPEVHNCPFTSCMKCP